MRLRYQVVDAFCEKPFSGNPAGVCVLDEWLPDQLMHSIAAENRLSETAFCVRRPDGDWDLRWFTPSGEIDLCGHATFGTAFALFEGPERDAASITFHAPFAGHVLICRRAGDMIEMDFPRIPPEHYDGSDDVAAAAGAQPADLLATERDLVAVFDDERIVRDMKPDLALVEAFSHGLSLYVTAPASDGFDYVARAFWPKLGIPEDPVCGSMQSALVPYWSQRLGRDELVCFEPSPRGGTVWCRDCGDTVRIAGHGRLYLEGTIEV